MQGHRWIRRTLGMLVPLMAMLIFAPVEARGQEVPIDSAGAAGAADSVAVDTAAALTAADYVARVRAEFTPENRRYANTGTVLAFVSPVYGILASLLILFAGWSARMRDIATRVTRSRYVHTLLYVTQYTVLSLVIALPFAWYSGYALEHQYGLSTQSFGAWFLDQWKGGLISVVVFGLIPVTWLAYGAIRKYRRWWLWLGAGTLPLILMIVVLQPILIDPMFNKFQPLEDKVLEARVLELAERTGIPGRNVFQVDKSEQTKALNAYVNGFGVSQRVVFWDTIIAAMDHDELAFVAGHEIGHYVLGHVWKSVGFVSLLSFLLFFLSAKLMHALVARFGQRWGFTELHDLASMPLLALAITLVAFFAQPARNAFSRYQEHQADIYALELTHMNDAGARAFLKLGSQNKSNPDPSAVQKWMLWSHPPIVERVRFMLEYRPWEEGTPNQLFEPGESGGP
jgi:Zn-dependent protease with chaperone function